MELLALQHVLSQIRSLGATLVAISPQLQHLNLQTVNQHKLGFDLLSDPGCRVARQFGLAFQLPETLRGAYTGLGLDLSKYNAEEPWVLPMPGTFILDQTSTIRFVDVDPDYTTRPEPSNTVAKLKEIAAVEERKR